MDKTYTTTHEQKEAFLALIRSGYGLRMAARELGRDVQTFPDLAKRDPEFKAALESAKHEMVEVLEKAAFTRASLSDKSDALLLALLRSHKPALYRERTGIELTNPDGSLVAPLTETERAAKIAAILAAAQARKDDDCADLL